MSTAEILAKYPHFHWTYCLDCNEPMYGEERPCKQPEGSSWTCGHCGAINLFHDSIEPVQLKQPYARSDSPSTHIGNIGENTPDPEVPSSNPTLSGM